MIKYFLTFSLLFIFLNLNLVSAEVNSKNIQSLDVEIIKSGIIKTSGNIHDMNIRLYIPQESLKEIQVSPNDWNYVEDDYGNKMILIHWSNPNPEERYEIKMRMTNTAKYLERINPEQWNFTEDAKKETNLTKATDEIRSLGYGSETILEKAARIAIWIYTNLKYENEPLKEKTLSAQWTYENRKGVCGEFAHLFAATLRAQNIPVRYVVGYAFNPSSGNLSEGEDFWAHAWNEIYVDGKWVPFDPTWLEGGYLDGSHIKFANLMDSSFFEEINYRGSGNVNWSKDPISVRIINHTETKIFDFNLIVEQKLNAGDTGLAELETKGSCSLANINLISCVDKNEEDVFNILDSSRNVWLCGSQKIYWAFLTSSQKGNYICPISAYDQTNSTDTKDVRIYRSEEKRGDLKIDGPEQISVGEKAVFKSNSPGIFFSPNRTDYSNSNFWSLDFKKSGRYVIYFYSNYQVGKKIVDVTDRKDFSFIEVVKPFNVTVDEKFIINATIKNLAKNRLPVTVKINFLNQSLNDSFSLEPNGEKKVSFILNATESGEKEFVLTSESLTLSSYSGNIYILEKSNIAKSIFYGLKDFINTIIKFIKNLFRG